MTNGSSYEAFECLFMNNHGDDGGALAGDHSSPIMAERTDFYNNSATSSGGAVFASGAGAGFVCVECLIVGNKAGSHVAAVAAGPLLKLTDTHVLNNTASSNTASWHQNFHRQVDSTWEEWSVTCTNQSAGTLMSDQGDSRAMPNCPVRPALTNCLVSAKIAQPFCCFTVIVCLLLHLICNSVCDSGCAVLRFKPHESL